MTHGRRDAEQLRRSNVREGLQRGLVKGVADPLHEERQVGHAGGVRRGEAARGGVIDSLQRAGGAAEGEGGRRRRAVEALAWLGLGLKLGLGLELG